MWHQKEENPFLAYALPEMPWNPKFEPFHEVKFVPKLGQSIVRDQNLISSEDGQDRVGY